MFLQLVADSGFLTGAKRILDVKENDINNKKITQAKMFFGTCQCVRRHLISMFEFVSFRKRSCRQYEKHAWKVLYVHKTTTETKANNYNIYSYDDVDKKKH